jgi:hypothetical protein
VEAPTASSLSTDLHVRRSREWPQLNLVSFLHHLISGS